MTGYPVAFVDETSLKLRGQPGIYMFASVIVDSDDLTDVIDASRQAAAGRAGFHATDLYHRGHLTPIEDMLDAIQAHAGWTVLVAHASHSTQENTRQTALARLLEQLNEQKVRDVVMDTRASERERVQAQLQGRKVTTADLPDMTTYRRLVRTQQISSRMRLMHLDDRQQPGLWMADAAAWSFQRALANDEPQWWSRITDIATIIDAHTGHELTLNNNRAAPPQLTSGDRGPEHLSQSAQASLLTSQFYTLTGGTTTRSQGPGTLFTTLLHQIETATHHGAQQQILHELRELNRGVAELATAIHQSAESQQLSVPSPASQALPEPETVEPETAAELTIE
ncbi:hypothetical protein [Actinoplanes aureus]|uniref:DUF3800 domain-containing protein n=1 Tax=Actinoplanes aureus TaxID=2792083 RepID=A0A931G6S7_9ACTN|nr:hypothetical protein [Actinoplanes aureus]MBG0567524.1 hypothetical protein [Actinoplanes aureus]